MRTPDICTYCGFEGDLQRDHVIPVAFLGSRTYQEDKQWIVDACRQCNIFAGSTFFSSIPDKAFFISKKYKKKFKKILSVPIWEDEEIEELSYSLRQGIKEAMIYRVVIQRRILHLERVAELPDNYLRPEWLERLCDEIGKKMRKRKRKNKDIFSQF